MHLEFLVEELSAKLALQQIVPKIIGTVHTFQIHDFGSKYGLLNRLEAWCENGNSCTGGGTYGTLEKSLEKFSSVSGRIDKIRSEFA